MLQAAALVVGSIGVVAAQTLAPGSTVGDADAAREMPVLRSNHPLAVEGQTTTRFSEAGVMVVLDKSHCS
jgi:hypothetical protein